MPDRPVTCPHCDTSLTPEPLAPGLWLCPCCSSVFEAPTAPDAPGHPAAAISERTDP